jgi:zinc D-Ala-D-Ala carboxypeptidase
MLSRAILIGAVVVLLGTSGFGLFSLLETQKSLAEATVRETTLSEKVASIENDNRALTEALDSERRQKESLEQELDDLDEKYDDLRKLQRTDSELLAKYSKVYFLSENYIPPSLIEIPQEYISNADKETFLRSAWKFLRDMVDDARDDGVDITIVSGYRSFETQSALKSGYKVTYGSGANAFSADQGYSEHQLGTTIDFSTKATGGALDGFQNTPAFAWLQENAYKYGFILSYPAGNTYYQYEPWHWRFVGKKLADDLHDDKQNFYDLDQRDIDKYLISLFD